MKTIGEREKLWSGELNNMRYFYSLSLQKFGRRALKWFSSRKKCDFQLFPKTNAVSAKIQINSWAKFKENWFSDPKRSRPVLGRLSLKTYLPRVREYRFQKPGNFCFWNPQCWNFHLWTPESWALESGTQLKDPESTACNPESKAGFPSTANVTAT